MEEQGHKPFFDSGTEGYRALFDLSVAATLILNSDGRVVDANAAAARLLGYNADELTSMSIEELTDDSQAFVGSDSDDASKGQTDLVMKNGDIQRCDYHFSRIGSEASGKATFGMLQITAVKNASAEDEHLRLFESVVKGTSDAVVIIKAPSKSKTFDAEIVFVNRAYTELSGYGFDELIGEPARFLEAPESAQPQLNQLREAIEDSIPIETELLSYKKNGEEFWVHISLTPVFDGDTCTHFIAIAKDITQRKNREALTNMQSEISRIFNNHDTLTESVDESLKMLLGLGDFTIAELWLADFDKQLISIAGHRSVDKDYEDVFRKSDKAHVFKRGEGLPGVTWDTGEVQFWRNIGENDRFVRNEQARSVGVQTAYGVPIFFDERVVGSLLLGVTEDQEKQRYYTPLLEQIGNDLGSEIDRKRTEEELNRIFSFSPDILCVAGMDGYFKQVNPSMSRLLGYSQDELLSHPISSFTHPDDRQKTENEIDALNNDEGASSFQNRYLTKSGKVVWLSWTTRTFFDEGKIYSVGRDITKQKELEILLRQANSMAKIGGWEFDVIKGEIFWSDIIREIHEVSSNYDVDLEKGINFYKEGESRETIKEKVREAIEHGSSFDEELQIVTAKGNERWVRVIGEVEIVQGQVKRIYGSFQDIDQRKTAEIRERELSIERERILESIGDVFFTLDEAFTVTFWNKKAEELFGFPQEEVQGKNLWSVFPDAIESKSRQMYERAFEENTSVSFEQYYGDSWFEVNAYRYGDGLSVICKDITQRKVAEQKNLEKTRQLNAIALFNGLLIQHDNWSDALDESLELFGKVLNADRVYYFQNSFSAELGEQTAVVTKEWADPSTEPRSNPDEMEEIPFSALGEFLEKLEKNQVYSNNVADISDSEFRELLTEHGIKSIVAVPVFVGSTFYGCIGFDDCRQAREWTEGELRFLETISINLASAIENEEAEAAVEKTLKEKKEILESIGDAFFAVDDDWTVTYWNSMAEEELDLKREEIVGKNLWDVFADATELQFYEQYHKALNEQVTVTFDEYYPAADKWFEVSAYPSFEGLSIFFKNVTERKKTERQLRDLNERLKRQAEELKASNAELEQFAFVASHDLQEPLRMVTSFLNQLEKKYADQLDDKAQQYIWFATDGAKRMRQMILDLLNYSRIGRASLSPVPVDLNELMDGIERDFRRTIEEKQAEVTWSSLPTITADKSSVYRLISNLVSNALKYSSKESKPLVEITAEEKKESWRVTVTDNGIGIGEEYRDRIFQVFQRLHSNNEYSGTGIGLAICRKIVEQHNGRIWVESNRGVGSRFSFEIPKLQVEKETTGY